ncbi:MAG: hypothetical protein AAF356_06805 [Planctomycetota bacterium]
MRRCAAQAAVVLGLSMGLCAGGCAGYAPREDVLAATARGSFGEARELVAIDRTTDPGARDFGLDRLKLLLLSLADGIETAAATEADALDDLLRTQGVNRDAGVGTVLAGEEASRVWKGQPYEQALAFTTIGYTDALRGEWDNARAAALNAQILVRDFSPALKDLPPDADPLQVRLALAAAGDPDEPDLGLSHEETRGEIVPALVLRAVAADQTGFVEERDEVLRRIEAVAPDQRDLVARLHAGAYNTLLVVDFGLVPERIAAGPSGAIAITRPRTPSDTAPLRIDFGGLGFSVPVALDVNELSRDLRWNGLEDLRRAKAALGSTLTTGGLIAAASLEDDEAQLAALAVAGVGAILQATARADTRHCELLPQRTYLALLSLPPEPSTLRVQIAGDPATRVTLPMARAPRPGEPASLIYVRMPHRGGPTGSANIIYANETTGATPGPQLPYILGGDCLRRPSHGALDDYQASGFLAGFTLNDLRDLYEAEDIVVVEGPLGRPPGRHLVDGGRYLYAAGPSTTGFARLYAEPHPPYVPVSPAVRELAARIKEGSGSPPSAPASPDLAIGATP